MLPAPLLASVRHDWHTPQGVLELVRQLGPLGLDVCTSADNPTGARRYLTSGPGPAWWPRWPHWVRPGEVLWANPPYGRELSHWVHGWSRLAGHDCAEHVHGVALTPARPDTRWFGMLWTRARAVCLWSGRLRFGGAPAAAPFPSALWYWGPRPFRFCDLCYGRGLVVSLR